jgi:hypothetical protein
MLRFTKSQNLELNSLITSAQMTVSAAQSYFAGITAKYWQLA